MSGDNRSRLKEWLESGEAKLYPATITQAELWETSPVPPGDGSNNICTVTKIKGAVSKEFCKKAMAMVVEKRPLKRILLQQILTVEDVSVVNRCLFTITML